MNTKNTDKEKSSVSEEPSQVYEKPGIEAEETFETFVLDCGYYSSETSACDNLNY